MIQSYLPTTNLALKTLGFSLFSLFCGVSEALPTKNEKVTHNSLVSVERYPATNPTHKVPQFSVDASWPTMPATWLMGQVPGLAVDKQNNVWVLHRPNSLSGLDLGLTNNTGLCCEAAPHVMQFSQAGELLEAWGGPELAPSLAGTNQWPATVHGLYVDDDNTVWLGGNGNDDHVVLNFTTKGKFIRQYGQRGKTDGNLSQDALGNPADIFHNILNNQVFIADGYINKRITAFDTKDNRFDQLWGAYGGEPGGGTRQGAFDVSQATSNSENTSTEAQSFGDIVHCVTQSKDGRIYVCDRRNNRIQVFKANQDGKVQFVQDVIVAGDTGGLGTASDIDFSPDNKYMYVADMMNGRIWILWHDTYEVLGSFGRPGRYPGQFTWLHSVVVDGDGNLYTSEVSSGRRVQKFVLTGFDGK
ncbi:beta-propeller fold lactonase family protein [Aliiglaciecola sp. 3_MG-2023]|uniref:beta-propeller fold lactonase family protein n=1 Tax=Aliiglaciecola sp. 3_MG-2023 TaxID=3062644 RepID=UPI0026E26356|nr:beta-propeller fold lactonase family protein [Aliiglaciecola sp. 3_MG-2023]MDO6694209.1 beta-propeller fold lactonase family protein [Aliiglaciecola sp. 3_MG-2023]